MNDFYALESRVAALEAAVAAPSGPGEPEPQCSPELLEEIDRLRNWAATGAGSLALAGCIDAVSNAIRKQESAPAPTAGGPGDEPADPEPFAWAVVEDGTDNVRCFRRTLIGAIRDIELNHEHHLIALYSSSREAESAPAVSIPPTGSPAQQLIDEIPPEMTDREREEYEAGFADGKAVWAPSVNPVAWLIGGDAVAIHRDRAVEAGHAGEAIEPLYTAPPPPVVEQPEPAADPTDPGDWLTICWTCHQSWIGSACACTCSDASESGYEHWQSFPITYVVHKFDAAPVLPLPDGRGPHETCDGKGGWVEGPNGWQACWKCIGSGLAAAVTHPTGDDPTAAVRPTATSATTTPVLAPSRSHAIPVLIRGCPDDRRASHS